MESLSIIDELNRIINERYKSNNGNLTVKAAVFFTFNLDIEFFEENIMPLLLPEIKFPKNKSGIAAMWLFQRKRIPKVSVYCDYNAMKKQIAPSLNYQINPLCWDKTNKLVCFHPKQSLILLTDNTLILITGSANMSVSGWLHNIESVSILELRNEHYFPANLKSKVRNFLCNVVPQETYNNTETPEYLLMQFFNQWLHKESINHETKFYDSTTTNFKDWLLSLRNDYNKGVPFDLCEIISPYLSDRTALIQSCSELFNEIKLLVPLTDRDVVSIPEELFNEYATVGAIWCDWVESLKTKKDKENRFVHAKIYHLKGKDHKITIVGSVNFTSAGWKNIQNAGNVETAIAFIEPVEKWKDILIPLNKPYSLTYSNVVENECSRFDERVIAPDFTCEINWDTRHFSYKLLENEDFQLTIGEPTVTKKRKITAGSEKRVKLNKNQLHTFASNPVARLCSYTNKQEYTYYPTHVAFERKPYTSSLDFTDKEFLSLWDSLFSGKEADDRASAALLENLILTYCKVSEEDTDEATQPNSILNTISAHLSTLVGMEKILFDSANKSNAISNIEYFLFTDSVNTFYAYRRLLKKMYDKKEFIEGIYFFLLKVLSKRFYNIETLLHIYQLNGKEFHLTHSLNSIQDELKDEINALKIEIKTGTETDMLKLEKWVDKQLN